MMGRPAQEMASVSSGSGRMYCEGEGVGQTEELLLLPKEQGDVYVGVYPRGRRY